MKKTGKTPVVDAFIGARRGIPYPRQTKTNCENKSKSWIILSIYAKRAFFSSKSLKINLKNIKFTDKVSLDVPEVPKQVPKPLLPQVITPPGERQFANCKDAGALKDNCNVETDGTQMKDPILGGFICICSKEKPLLDKDGKVVVKPAAKTPATPAKTPATPAKTI